MVVLYFFFYGVRGCVFLGKKLAWDVGGLVVRNIYDGNFFDWGCNEREMRVCRRGVYLYVI